ncbi:MAG: metallophosphoesterase [Kiritimatiellae bacterium]|nr:metallophosphoesterase [Kiritimatiellia bacterium]
MAQVPYFSRRSFLAGAVGAVGTSLLAGQDEGVPASGPGQPNVTFGVLSDVHLNRPGDEDTFLKALTYFRDNGADGVLVAGDIADRGRVEQLQRAGDCWFSVFPDGKAPDGRAVEQLFVYGNHDVDGWKWGGMQQYPDEAAKWAHAIGYADNRAKVWERIFKEPYQPIWAKTVKGYTFIGSHWGNEKDLDTFLQTHAARLNLAGNRPFFYTQHPHPGNTVQGPWAWGNDGGVATRALEKFPNAVAFSGHSHYSLTDERSIWQGAFTSVGTSSLRYIFSQYWRDNGENHNNIVKQMEMLPEQTGRQGMLVKVYDDRMVIERREFVYGESLGGAWVVPLDGSRPFTFEARSPKRVAPAFAPDATVTVSRGMGKDRNGKETDQITVGFPAAKPNAKARVHDYEVTALAYHEDVDYPVASKRVLSESYFLPPTREAAAGKIVFAVSELKGANAVRFAVRPLECFGHKGPEIFSEMVNL